MIDLLILEAMKQLLITAGYLIVSFLINGDIIRIWR